MSEAELIELLKQVSYLEFQKSGDRWLYWSKTLGGWRVFRRRVYERRNTLLYQGEDLLAALKVLLNEEVEK